MVAIVSFFLSFCLLFLASSFVSALFSWFDFYLSSFLSAFFSWFLSGFFSWLLPFFLLSFRGLISIYLRLVVSFCFLFLASSFLSAFFSWLLPLFLLYFPGLISIYLRFLVSLCLLFLVSFFLYASFLDFFLTSRLSLFLSTFPRPFPAFLLTCSCLVAFPQALVLYGIGYLLHRVFPPNQTCTAPDAADRCVLHRVGVESGGLDRVGVESGLSFRDPRSAG
jgi:hypothetical protein